jgi:hypothetical protein
MPVTGIQLVRCSLPSSARDQQGGGELSDLERRLADEIRAGIRLCKKELNYNPTYFSRMVADLGPVEACRQLVQSRGVSEGFATLWEHHRLDLSVEALVLLPWAAEIFEESDRRLARGRLAEYGFDVDEFIARHEAGTITVPESDAPWQRVWSFALTWNAYDRLGGFHAVASQASDVKARWQRSGELPNDLETVRTALFLAQRSYRHSGEEPSGQGADYVRGLLDKIRDLSGGAVPGPPDPLP